MSSDCHCLKQTLADLDSIAPSAPLLALGQTVFWDEPMKAGILREIRRLGSDRPFVAGVHDTDYFAKFVSGSGHAEYRALPHNDTTTKSLWSAAGEFSCLFGSETVITREALHAAGGKIGKVLDARPGFLDEITEAWGWRGVVSMSKESKITAEKSVSKMFPEIFDTLRWAIDESLQLVSGPHFQDSVSASKVFLEQVCQHVDSTEDGLAAYYERLLRPLFESVVGESLDFSTSRTTRLLQFNSQTAKLARFEVVNAFLNPQSRNDAEAAYNHSVIGSDIYSLDRFGAGALPFDLYVPGIGRGTLRLGTKGGLVMAQTPVGFSYKKRPTNVQELAEILEAKFGSEVVLVGKAVTLITMLAREFVFVFHEGASGYVWRSAKFAKGLAATGQALKLHPILRVKYEPWDALDDCCAWLKLPEPLVRPFGTLELSAPSFARRWREVAASQRKVLEQMATLKRPLQLLQYLQEQLGGQWECLAKEYEGMHDQLEQLADEIGKVRAARRKTVLRIRATKARRNALQHAKGEHWRDQIFEKEPTAEELERRARFDSQIEEANREQSELRRLFLQQEQQQIQLVQTPEIDRIRQRRNDIALEAEMMRLRMIREATVATKGLEKAGHRPSAWWFPLICPGGTWFDATMKRAEFRLEHLS